MAKLVSASAGQRGFDCDAVVTLTDAKAMRAKGFTFAARYVGRDVNGAHDLTLPEVTTLLSGGLAVTPVQHVESESSWVPSGEKGTLYGCNAALFARNAGIASGAVVWCDLEGVDESVDDAAIIAYCRAWYRGVTSGSFIAGLYIGWHCGLTPTQLYALPFTHYWAAYNLDADEEPTVRGCQMRQHAAKDGDDPRGLGIDVNTVSGDKRGGVPIFFAPDNWP